MSEDKSQNPEHFDPQANPGERLRVRYEYRELIAATEKNRHEFIRPDSRGLHKALDQGEELFSKVKQTREAVLDSHFLVVSSTLGAQQVQQLQTHLVKFEPEVFAAKLITFMGGRNLTNQDDDDDDDGTLSRRRQREVPPLDWNKLGEKVSSKFRKTPSLTFMFGPLAFDPPEKKKPQQRAKKTDKPDASQKVIPSQLDKIESQEEATTKEVTRVYSCLVKATVPTDVNGDLEPVCFFNFVINPDSFGQTVENIFHLSFLIKEGRASISLKDGLPYISPSEPYREEQGKRVQQRKQVIMNISLQEYKEAIKVFEIKQALIPTRPRIQPGRSGTMNGHNGTDHGSDSD
ncbi:non-structural maintenance of chromosomes element 4 homolog A isoform X2 [Nematostella vectensis]|uniref:non-structural maintenance of chromosomes element 4 homolog A isoform X2 n=1 Tax=Nematostella vectensis TaxID=45351 RepID=UPI002076FDB1|nr:non-structural maintenance of chromosomes element 4 homolog A isoform X2 [Nematostella vectensis]